MRAVLFDFDGLILDTESPEVDTWAEIFAEHGCELPLEWWFEHIGRGADQVVTLPEDLLEERVGGAIDRPAVRSGYTRRVLEAIDREQIRPGIAELIEEAKASGLLVAVASSSHLSWLEKHLKRLGIWDRFDAIACADDCPRTKPAPDIYLKALEKLGIEPGEAVALEDSPTGIRGAKAAGIPCVAIPNRVSIQLDLRHADAVVPSAADLDLSRLQSIANSAGSLETDRLLLMPWSIKDVEDALPIYGDPEVTRWLNLAPIAGPEEQREKLIGAVERFAALGRGFGFWKVIVRSTNQVVGTLLVKPLPGEPPEGKIEVGWHLRRDAWGRGYATEAAQACVRHAFRALGKEEIFAIALPQNERSLAVMKRLGMVRLGTTRDYYELELELWRLAKQ